MYRIRKMDLRKADAAFMKALRNLSFRGRGNACIMFAEIRKGDPGIHHSVLYYIEEDGVLLAWCLLYQYKHSKYLHGFSNSNAIYSTNLQFYTRVSHRGQGLAAKLGNKAIADHPGVKKFTVWEQHSSARRMFNKL